MSKGLIAFLTGCVLALTAIAIIYIVHEDHELRAACEARGGVHVESHYSRFCFAQGVLK